MGATVFSSQNVTTCYVLAMSLSSIDWRSLGRPKRPPCNARVA
jgi:hypothetical protein